jgi:hypothetical protein
MTHTNPDNTCDVCRNKDTCPAIEAMGGRGCDNYFEREE